MRLHRSKRAWWLVSAALVVVLLFATAPSLLANLPNSGFEGNDGNLDVTTAGNKDWQNAPNLASGAEKASGQDDDSLGGGAKEDIPDPRVVSGSIPNNKSDLTRFYVANESVTLLGNGVKIFLYLAWERANTLGTANIDFEINQLADTGKNGITPVRTAGDILVTYDFEQGGSSPVLGLLTWITDPAAAGQCFSARAAPCWGNHVNLSAAGFAEGAINAGPITDPLTGLPLSALTFGEAAIDLNLAGVAKANECKHFGRSFVKSRSSTSFPAELKDFIAPIPVSIDTCGTLKIVKHDDLNRPLAGATFSVTPNPGTGTGSLTVTDGGLNDDDGVANGEIIIAPAMPIEYTVTETAAPDGWVGSSAVVNVTVGAAGAVTAGPFINTLGSIEWEKRDSQGNLLGGATFSISPNPYSCWGGSLSSVVDGDASDKDAAGGQLKLGRVCLGSYTITETAAPSNYAIDTNPIRTVEVTAGSPNQVIGIMDSDDPTLDFHNRPLLKLLVQVLREDDNTVVGGVTLSLGSLEPGTCGYNGASTQVQEANPTVETGEWYSLQYGCNGTGPGYHVTIQTPN